jgi:hypothetical protein
LLTEPLRKSVAEPLNFSRPIASAPVADGVLMVAVPFAAPLTDTSSTRRRS